MWWSGSEPTTKLEKWLNKALKGPLKFIQISPELLISITALNPGMALELVARTPRKLNFISLTNIIFLTICIQTRCDHL